MKLFYLFAVVLFSNTLFAKSVTLQPISGKIHNFSSLDTTKIKINVGISCTAGLIARSCGSVDKTTTVNPDGTFLTPKLSYSHHFGVSTYFTFHWSVMAQTPWGEKSIRNSIISEKGEFEKELKNMAVYLVKPHEVNFDVNGISFEEWLTKIDLNRFFYTVSFFKAKEDRPVYEERLEYLQKDHAQLSASLIVIPASSGKATKFIVKSKVTIHGNVNPIVYRGEESVDLSSDVVFSDAIVKPQIQFDPSAYTLGGEWFVRIDGSQTLIPSFALKVKCVEGQVQGTISSLRGYSDEIIETMPASGSCQDGIVQFNYENRTLKIKTTKLYPGTFEGTLEDEKGNALGEAHGFRKTKN